MSEKALVIDANALLHRAWHALPPLTSPDGVLVNAIYGFSMVLLKVLDTERPDYLAVCWDTAAPTFRHTAEPQYKAQREEQPQEFYDQAPEVKKIVTALGGTNLELDGYEADDLLGTLAVRFSSKNVEVTLLTSDKDAWQAIGKRVRVVAFKKGVTETMTYDEENLKTLVGLRPDQIVDFKAMRGDASDNLKGVPGIGEVTATKLLQTYDDLDRILKAAHDPKSEMTASVRNKLLAGEASARATLPLVRLVTNVPIVDDLNELKRRSVDVEELKNLFVGFGFKTLLSRLALKDETYGPSQRINETNDRIAKNNETKPGSCDTTSDIKSFAAKIKAGDEIFLQQVALPQESLFGDVPIFALASDKEILAVSQHIIDDEAGKSALRILLEDDRILKSGHGLKRAVHWCAEKGLHLRGLGFDTEIAAYLLSAGEGGHDLDELAKDRLGLIRKADCPDVVFFVDAIRKLAPGLKAEIEQDGLVDILDKYEMPLIPVLAEMEENGIKIDKLYFKKLSQDFTAEKSRLEKEMVTLAGEEFNPASPTQLSHILFDVLGVSTKGIKRGKTGISTAAAELDKLKDAHPIIEKIAEYREVAKLLSTYIDTLPQLADADDRIHTTFNQVATATGRLSSVNPNLQNIPIRTDQGRRIRRGFVASEGFVLLSCDYSQIELRVIAALSKDKMMLQAFAQGHDIHSSTAAAIWGVSLDAVTKEMRRAAKAINFGIVYGQGPQGLARSAGIPMDQARVFIDDYFQVYSGIKEFLDTTRASAHEKGYVETLFGRRRKLKDINSSRPDIRAASERMAINMPVQGTAADMMKLAMIKVHDRLPDISKSSRMLLQVHDELVFEVPFEEVGIVAEKVKILMEEAEHIGCPIVVEAKQGANWEEMRKL
ncbi:MAG: DNA polymerase I [Patescibacteria group bacterium]|nr:DNA polymerase I [Patescibacteria group bacterium]